MFLTSLTLISDQVQESAPLVGKTKKPKSDAKFYSDDEEEKEEKASESGSSDSSSSSSSSSEGLSLCLDGYRIIISLRLLVDLTTRVVAGGNGWDV